MRSLSALKLMLTYLRSITNVNTLNELVTTRIKKSKRNYRHRITHVFATKSN